MPPDWLSVLVVGGVMLDVKRLQAAVQIAAQLGGVEAVGPYR